MDGNEPLGSRSLLVEITLYRTVRNVRPSKSGPAAGHDISPGALFYLPVSDSPRAPRPTTTPACWGLLMDVDWTLTGRVGGCMCQQ